ncbi:uncharacterized protein EV154DRAFT_603815 [Mucor mucedo]|uniref:uncharacterized protein n=1 Tax=Mucor mucedo TaxID=29922 RepID=UPI0022201C4C|nr:uncharacterized protein EV154DRAFT_603815 [Mucor mucedo]KAI7889688.1 hypothetical protein EV154DRAFT_603815 [Mucor mucedo]
MFPYKEDEFLYTDALDLKYAETEAVAAKHHAKQTVINMTFDTVEDVAGFTSAVFKDMDYHRYYQNDVLSESNYYPSPLQTQHRRHNGEKGKIHSLDLQYEGSPTGYYDGYRRSSLYGGEQEYSNRYLVASPEHYHNHNVPIIKKRRNKQKNRNFPVTPEDEKRHFVYSKDAEDNNQMHTYHNNGTGDSLIHAKEEEEEEEEEDTATHINTLINSESRMVDAVADDNLDVTAVKINLDQEKFNQKKQKWYTNMALGFVKKVKTLKKKEVKQEPLKQQPAIQVISALDNELLGDVLDADQQKKIVTQLSSSSPMSTSFNMCPEKAKVTNLPRIWVFRLLADAPEENQPIAWIGFDYENQVKIENHIKELPDRPEDGRLAIYDSHVRHGKMPVIVTPNHTKGYYFADEEQSKLITLEVTFIENNHEKFNTALSWLPEEEHESVLRFKHDRDRHLALGSRLLRRHYFSGRLNVAWASLEFEQLPLCKPTLIDYNISHQGNWVIFGATTKNAMKIGIDAVTVDRPNSSSIDDFLTDKEVELIMNNQDEDTKLATFFELWGCKESYVKALGVGLSLELNKIDFRNDHNQIKMNFEGNPSDSWLFHLSYLDNNTLAVVCYGKEDVNHKLDSKLLSFASTTQLLGQRPLHAMTNDIFEQVRYEDIENDKR